MQVARVVARIKNTYRTRYQHINLAYKIPFDPTPTATTTTGATPWKVRRWRWSLLKNSIPLLSRTLGQTLWGKCG
jgi:hypothetical protein